ncbi:MAG: AAA family ATPase [Hyphomicrobiales bacterium]|jgi:pilus assembly protein CpaE|nr:AAA family ATPase [Hyphomicrobiales bacterium]
MSNDSSAMFDLNAEVIAPVPRITLQAFCESHDVAAAVQSAISDRRMQKALSKVQMGGPVAAVEAFQDNPTPNALILENTGDGTSLIAHLDKLAEVCDAGTRVIVVGHLNDVSLYRELTRKGVSDYLITPVSVIDIVRSVSQLFASPGAATLGRTISVVGSKGGVGASTVAHNVAWAISQNLDSSTVLVDLDLAFGTAGLDFNQDPPQGVADAIFAPDRIDQAMVDRLLSRCSENLSLMAAPAILDKTFDLSEESMDQLIEILRGLVPTIVLDVPHLWNAWARRVIVNSDDILIVATPDLASLRNAKNLMDLCRATRTHDRQPQLMLNMVGMPKRPEISAAEFAKTFGMPLSTAIPFDAQLFGTAANNGQMIAEVQPSGPITQHFIQLASGLMGRLEAKRGRKSLIEPILAKLTRRKAK